MSSRPRSVVFGMTGCCGLSGGIAAANLNNLVVLGEWAAAGRIDLEVLSLLERHEDRPPFLPPEAGWRAFAGSKARFAAALVGAARRRPVFVFDLVGIAAPAWPFAVSGWAELVLFAHGPEYWRDHRPRDLRCILASKVVLTNSEHTLRKMREHLPPFSGRACVLGLPPTFVLNDRPPDPDHGPWSLPAADGEERPLGERVLLMTARMDPDQREKGHDWLLDVWAELRRTHPEAQLVFVGPGSDRERLIARARATGHGEGVFFPGFVSWETLARLYRRSFAFVMPSLQEGFGIVYLEAMNQARACLACSDQGAEDIVVPGETGLLVDDPRDPAQLLAALRSLLDDAARTRRMGLAGFERLHATFTAAHHQERVRRELGPVVGVSPSSP